jgi:hypothetical protein
MEELGQRLTTCFNHAPWYWIFPAMVDMHSFIQDTPVLTPKQNK